MCYIDRNSIENWQGCLIRVLDAAPVAMDSAAIFNSNMYVKCFNDKFKIQQTTTSLSLPRKFQNRKIER